MAIEHVILGSPLAVRLPPIFGKSPVHAAVPGVDDAKGEFALKTWRQGDGAVAGDHSVTVQTIIISGWTADLSPIETNAMPQKYEKPETSGLTATISDKGKNVLSFEVVGPRRGPTTPAPFPGQAPAK